MARPGRPRQVGVKRDKSGRRSRTRDELLAAGKLVHDQWAVYFARSEGRVKIGYSGSLNARLDVLAAARGAPVELIGVVLVPSADIARQLEKKLHQRFAELRSAGEWYFIAGGDVRAVLADCRKLGLQVLGGSDASDDVPLMSGLAHSDQHKSIVVNRA